MKFFFAALFLTGAVYAKSSSSILEVNASVPLILRVSATPIHGRTYLVREISNSSDGYLVLIETDAKSVQYDGKPVTITGGQGVLTQTPSQTGAIDQEKDLNLPPQTTFFRLSIHPPY